MMCTSIRHDSESDFYDLCEAPDGYKYIKHVKTLYLIRRKIKWVKSLVLI